MVRVLPTPVAEVCETFLDVVPPDLVVGLYLRGGTGFGEWVPGRSDVDFVATLDHRLDDAEVASLRRAHAVVAERHPSPFFDGMHVLPADLAADPELLAPVPTVHLHTFDPRGTSDALITFHELARHGVTVMGRPHHELEIWTDQERLLAFTRTNLDTYWRATLEQLTAAAPGGVDDEATLWCVLGVVRLQHLLTTGAMTTKSAAGRWALTTVPERFHRVVREALRLRDGGVAQYVGDPTSRGLDVTALTAYVVGRGSVAT